MSTERANSTALRTVALPGGEAVPVLGIGTWGMAEHPPSSRGRNRRAAEGGPSSTPPRCMREARPSNSSRPPLAIGAARSSWSARLRRLFGGPLFRERVDPSGQRDDAVVGDDSDLIDGRAVPI